MSTSSKPALESSAAAQVRSFAYPEIPISAGVVPGMTQASSQVSSEEQATRDLALREQGRQEGESRARAECQAQISQVRASVGAALADFAKQRAVYYQQVEAEMVKLAFSIAHKILHREAQVDPLLLASLVHLALQQIESGTKVLLRVHPHQVSEFRSYFAQHMEAQNVPEVMEDPAVGREGCVLQTSLGTTKLGIEVQLKEIEQGLFDLLAQRPQGLR